jgi:hypothetical protein
MLGGAADELPHRAAPHERAPGGLATVTEVVGLRYVVSTVAVTYLLAIKTTAAGSSLDKVTNLWQVPIACHASQLSSAQLAVRALVVHIVAVCIPTADLTAPMTEMTSPLEGCLRCSLSPL